ncbi:MAG TPA: exodeoxyribonuclease VII large subunit [Myxococcota bacterium]|nr:exodeoxyribonuclease VII large subunit [Myxococcota bacterium]
MRVSELVAGLRTLLEHRVGRVWVAGEISNLRSGPSGHCYFTLKDEGAQIKAALFRSAARRLPFLPEEGLEVLVLAEATLYEPRGELQLLVRHLEPRGRGALQLAFEQLRARLEAQGLFDPARQRALPLLPRAVGVVTSPQGAALRDVVEVTGRRCPGVPLLLAAARVQGEGAEHEIAAALAALGARPDVEVILLVRGGGALEDLQPFNTERVARAIRATPVPVVSGVGHEVDLTIADLAADARAPTPSAAAALAVPDRAAIALRLGRDGRRLVAAARRALERAQHRHARAHEGLRRHAPTEQLRARRTRLDAASRALPAAARRALERKGPRLRSAAARLDALSPLAVLGRGYALVQRVDTGAIVRRAGELAPGDALRVRLGEGEVRARVDEAPATDASSAASAPAETADAPDPQGVSRTARLTPPGRAG